MSKLLKHVYQLLGIRGLRTTPYHPQTDGWLSGTTRHSGRCSVNLLTLAQIGTGGFPICCLLTETCPQAITGFSPFELLFGHEV